MSDPQPSLFKAQELEGPPPDPLLPGRLNALLADPNFLRLKHREERFNLFKVLGTSHTEQWHSAFLRWLLDPGADHGLGEFPLKRFLVGVVLRGVGRENVRRLPSIGDIERMDLRGISLTTEAPIGSRSTKDGLRWLDIYGCLGRTGRKDEAQDTPFLQLLIENKVNSSEAEGQTHAYAKWGESQGCEISFYVYLTRRNADPSKNKNFVQFTYQDLMDEVLMPSLGHPLLDADSRILLEHYMDNLTSTASSTASGTPLAQGDKDLCAEIYKVHERVLEEIFRAIKGEIPTGKAPRTAQRFGVSLQDLIEAGLLQLGQGLVLQNKNQVWTAKLVECDGMIHIQPEKEGQESSPAPSWTASNLVGRPMNGWATWILADGPNAKKSLADLRDQFLKSEAAQECES